MPNGYKLSNGRLARERGRCSSGRRYSRFAPQVLAFFARHRTALAQHVQRQFPDAFPIDRTTRLHLQTLVAAGELGIMREPAAGQPNVYVITTRGLRAAGVETIATKRRRPTGSHLGHELVITEVAVSLAEAARRRNDVALAWEERFTFATHAAFRSVAPDYGFLFRHNRGLLVCFVEVSCGEESPTRIGEKLDRYAAWADSPEGQVFLTDLYRQHGAQVPRPVFRLLFIVQNRQSGRDLTRLRQVFAAAMRLPRTLRRRLWGTTVADLATSASIDAPVWIRGEDLEEGSAAWGAAPQAKRAGLLDAALPAAPRHALFPAPGGTES